MLSVDPNSTIPPYEQVRSQLEAQIRAGKLEAGTRLPAVRRLAQDLGIAAGTVARAYRELELAGLVTASRRGGTVVTERIGRLTGNQARAADPGAPSAVIGQVQEPIAHLVQKYISALRTWGLTDESILRHTQAALALDRTRPANEQ